MTTLNMIIHLSEITLYVALLVFISTTMYLIRKVKRSNFEFVSNAVRNPLLPNFNLNFFKKLQERYVATYGGTLLPIVNRISFITLMTAFFLLFFSAIARELFQY